jgi:dimethylglycine catabolism B
MHKLPLLEPARTRLETCVFCPKLCRSACPVSNAEPRETLTPWGKMSMAYFVAQSDVAANASFAAPSWACTGCEACRAVCDHENEVATTLFTARAGLFELGIAPEAASRTVRRFRAHLVATENAVSELRTLHGVARDSKTALLVGCAYARAAPREARDAIVAAHGLVRGPVSLVQACCGLPLLHAGDRRGFAREALALATETSEKSTLLVADAGCAHALRVHYPSVPAALSPTVELLVERAAADLGRLERMAAPPDAGASVRYHDPCLLGRGLGVYEAPRAVLARALGRAPDEFDARREGGHCSGAGGLLPRTMPETSRRITKARLEEHEEQGGGTVVTACASSLLAFRRRANTNAADLVSFLARAVPPWRP